MRIAIQNEETPGRERYVELPTVPRIGEEVVLHGLRMTVVRVEHLIPALRFLEDEISVRLVCVTTPAVGRLAIPCQPEPERREHQRRPRIAPIV